MKLFTDETDGSRATGKTSVEKPEQRVPSSKGEQTSKIQARKPHRSPKRQPRISHSQLP